MFGGERSAPTTNTTPVDWAAQPTEALLPSAGAGSGLSSGEAKTRLAQYGPNALRKRRQRTVLLQFLDLFRNPLIGIMVIAAGVAAATGEVVNAAIVLVMVLTGILINFVQAYRSQAAVEALQQQMAATSRALRDGATVAVPRETIVPGDVVVLAAGEIVPADGRLLEAVHLFVNEAALTGESLPAEKRADATLEEANLRAGTTVVSGTGTLLVCATGGATAFGAIAERLTTRPPETEFERGGREFATMISRIVMVLVLFVVLVNVIAERDPLETFLFAIALAIGLTPELLPMILSVTLARGAVRMSRKRVIVKHLPAIQNLGSMDVLCSDKTGTLTMGALRMERSVGPDGAERPETGRLAGINSHLLTTAGSPLDDAIRAAQPAPMADLRKTDEMPFDFERRRVSVTVHDAEGLLLICKGAPENVLDVCSEVRSGASSSPLTSEVRAQAMATLAALSEQGLRTLGVATRRGVGEAGALPEKDLTFEGFVTFLDEPKPDAAAAIRALNDDGVRVIILTGDEPHVAHHICDAIGLDVGEPVTGAQIDLLTEKELALLAEQRTLFARVNPAQKDRVIRALQSHRHVVGVLGDGINDAPSLHTADVGISVANAVEVARDAADFILLESDLRVIHDGVMEGRRSFGNVMKYLLMGSSSSFGNMFSMAAATLFLPFLPMLPTQVLLNDLLYETSQIALPADDVDPAFVRKPRHWDVRFIRRFMVTMGPVSSVFDLLTFGAMIWLFDANESLFHTGWFLESVVTQALVIFVIRTSGNPLRARPSRLLAATVGIVVAVALLLPISPLANALGFVAPPADFLLFLVGVVAIYLLLTQQIKRWFYARAGLLG